MGRAKRTTWVADFETITNPFDCRVWGWGFVNIDTAESVDDVEIGTDIDSFIERLMKLDSVVYFHNLAFDGSFLIDKIFRMGFRHVDANTRNGEFTTFINSMGKFYSMTVQWANGKRTEFRDSLKKLPMSVKRVAKSFSLEETKGDIDYHKPRPIGYEPTPEERDYIARDVIIVAHALKKQFEEGMTRLTVGSDALAEFKKLQGSRMFSRMFPVLPALIDDDIRTAYRGGFTYADERFKGRLLECPGRVYDVNSLYPSVMYNELLPYGEPERFDGMPTADGNYPLYIVSITFTAKLKKDHIPCIQVKGSTYFINTEYQRDIDEPVTLMCSNVDLELWEEHYDMEILAYNGGYRFRGARGVFKEYITKWMEVKKTSTGGLRELAKLMLNSLYGKFATNPNITPKVPFFEDDYVKLRLGDEATKDPVYTAMGVFITAYARDKTIRAAQQHYDVFAYADTDSLHLLIDQDPETLEIDPHELGAWKFEYDFDSAIFVRAKAYIEHVTEDHWHEPDKCEEDEHTAGCQHVTHIAGMPDNIAHKLTLDDIIGGREFRGKLVPKRVPGGIYLHETGFTLHL